MYIYVYTCILDIKSFSVVALGWLTPARQLCVGRLFYLYAYNLKLVHNLKYSHAWCSYVCINIITYIHVYIILSVILCPLWYGVCNYTCIHLHACCHFSSWLISVHYLHPTCYKFGFNCIFLFLYLTHYIVILCGWFNIIILCNASLSWLVFTFWGYLFVNKRDRLLAIITML